MKYVVLEVTDEMSSGPMVREVPFVFSEHCIHEEVAKAMTRMLRAERPDGRTRAIRPVAAGFLSCLTFSDANCYGQSESLGIASRGAVDDSLLRMYDYTHGHK